MAKPVSSAFALGKSANADGQASSERGEFSRRLREASGRKGWSQAELARQAGVPTARVNEYWKGPKVPTADYLFALADALGVYGEWLARGTNRGNPVNVADADQADWVVIDEYDLRDVGELGKGEAKGQTPFRRDWLNRTLGTSTGLWLTRMLSDYPPADLAEGSIIFCSDIGPADLLDRQLCIFRVNHGLVTGRFTYRSDARPPASEQLVLPSQIGTDDDSYVPVARILAKLLMKV